MQQIDYRNKYNLEGKVAVVTGSAGIIGKELCKGLLQMGAQVIGVDVSENGTEDLLQQLTMEQQKRFISKIVDVSDATKIQLLADELSKDTKINIVYNNAAWKTEDLQAFFASTEEYSLETWRNVCRVNIDAVFSIAQTFGKLMRKQGHGGAMIMTASIYGVCAPDQRIYEGSEYLGMQISSPAVYSATKSAVLGLMRHLAAEWGKDNIRVNAITPGGISSGQNTTFSEKYAHRTMLGRMAQAEDIVSAMLFLGSDAAQYITGQNLIVDGGLTAW